ncbi:hypothetical protein, partial [Acinetobacter baumannii]|uniref:hypothetical protein n=1 Tax=Acinetobacter baumannii TaxID=470 RepID=UPI0011779E47
MQRLPTSTGEAKVDSEACNQSVTEEESDDDGVNVTIIAATATEGEERTDNSPTSSEEPTPSSSNLDVKVDSMLMMLADLRGQVTALSEQVASIAKEL